MLDAIRQPGPRHLCFGSDMPFGMMHVQLAAYNGLLRDYDEETRRLVMVANLAQLLGVKEIRHV